MDGITALTVFVLLGLVFGASWLIHWYHNQNK